MGLVVPDEAFLKGLRAECDRVGALLIFDEVITGFRVARGGAQARNGITPDLTTFGKVIGGGLNIGAYGGRADVMQQVAPLRSEEHTSELQSLMRTSYAVFCLKKQKTDPTVLQQWLK